MEVLEMNERTPQPETRKPYQRPRLIVYGDIRKLTSNIARNTRRDGGGNNMRT